MLVVQHYLLVIQKLNYILEEMYEIVIIN